MDGILTKKKAGCVSVAEVSIFTKVNTGVKRLVDKFEDVLPRIHSNDWCKNIRMYSSTSSAIILGNIELLQSLQSLSKRFIDCNSKMEEFMDLSFQKKFVCTFCKFNFENLQEICGNMMQFISKKLLYKWIAPNRNDIRTINRYKPYKIATKFEQLDDLIISLLQKQSTPLLSKLEDILFPRVLLGCPHLMWSDCKMVHLHVLLAKVMANCQQNGGVYRFRNEDWCRNMELVPIVIRFCCYCAHSMKFLSSEDSSFWYMHLGQPFLEEAIENGAHFEAEKMKIVKRMSEDKYDCFVKENQIEVFSQFNEFERNFFDDHVPKNATNKQIFLAHRMDTMFDTSVSSDFQRLLPFENNSSASGYALFISEAMLGDELDVQALYKKKWLELVERKERDRKERDGHENKKARFGLFEQGSWLYQG